jgi:hypothetical protein
MSDRPTPGAFGHNLRRRLSTAEFTRRFVKFDGKEIDPSAEWPWIAEPLEYMDRVRAAIFLMKASVQSYKSTAAELFNARQIALNPGRALWYFPTGDAGKDFAQEKWKKLIDACPAIQRVLYDSPHKNTTLALDLPFGHFRMVSANVEGDRNSKSARDITCDEAWEYEPGWLTDIQARYTSYENEYRLIIPTSGEDLGSEVSDIWTESDQRTWHSRCPQCHADFIPDFRFLHELDRPGGLRFDRSEAVLHADGSVNTTALAATVRLQCPHCRHEHPFTPALQKHLNTPAHGARHLPLNPKPKERVHAWNWNALVNLGWPTLAELQLKAELAQARGDLSKLEVFVRKRAARAWSEAAYIKIKTGTDEERGDYALSATPLPDALFHTMLVDVQQDHFWYRVRAWFSDVSSKLLACGKVVSSLQLRQIQHQYGIKDHGGDIRFDEDAAQWVFGKPCQVYLDGNYNPAMVRRLAASYNWCVLRGEDCKEFLHKDGFYKIYSEIRAIDAFEGTVHNGSRYVAEIRFSNNAARNRFALLRSIDAPKRLWTYAKDAGETYVKHLNAWVRVEKKNKAGITLGYEWRQVADRDDLFWCEKADIVVASMAGLIGVSDTAGKDDGERKSTDDTNVQRRSGDEPASQSVLTPNDQPPAPERSL